MNENRGFNYGYGDDCLNQPLHRWVGLAMTTCEMWDEGAILVALCVSNDG